MEVKSLDRFVLEDRIRTAKAVIEEMRKALNRLSEQTPDKDGLTWSEIDLYLTHTLSLLDEAGEED